MADDRLYLGEKKSGCAIRLATKRQGRWDTDDELTAQLEPFLAYLWKMFILDPQFIILTEGQPGWQHLPTDERQAYRPIEIDPDYPWRPIEDAPQDGTFVLCKLKSGFKIILQFCAQGFWRSEVDDPKGKWEPRQFMLMPE